MVDVIRAPRTPIAVTVGAEITDTTGTTPTTVSAGGGSGPTVGSTPLVAGSDVSSAAFELSGTAAFVTSDNSVITGFPFTISAIINATTESREDHRMIFDGENASGHYVEMAIYGAAGPPAGAGRLRVAMYDGTATKTLFSSDVVDGDETHHVCWTAASAADWRLYVDGIDVSTHLSGHGASSTVTFPTIDSGWSMGNTPGTDYGDYGFGGNLAHVLVWNDRALTPARVAAHADAALTAWAGDTTAERLTHLLNAIGWPTSERNIGTGVSTVGIVGYTGLALDYALELGQTENGMCYQDGRGRTTFVGRHALLSDERHITSQGVFGDGDGSSGSTVGFDDATVGFDDAVEFDGGDGAAVTELRYSQVVPTFNNTNIRNQVEITPAGAFPILSKDDTSIASYGLRSYQRSSLSASDLDASNIGRWILSHYKDPLLRFDRLTVLPRTDPDGLWPQVLGREIGDKITVRRRPQNIGDMIEKDVLIEGVTHTVTPEQWVTSWDLTPAETLAYWILGTSELDSDTRLAY